MRRIGKLTLRHGSRLHHLGIGRHHAHTPVLILVATPTVTVISKTGHRFRTPNLLIRSRARSCLG
jgi:hypothetical protein